MNQQREENFLKNSMKSAKRKHPLLQNQPYRDWDYYQKLNSFAVKAFLFQSCLFFYTQQSYVKRGSGYELKKADIMSDPRMLNEGTKEAYRISGKNTGLLLIPGKFYTMEKTDPLRLQLKDMMFLPFSMKSISKFLRVV